jgi:hypothetical protein
MQDWLGCGFRKQPFADEAAEFLLPNQVRITPDGEVILLVIQHQRFGNCPCLPSVASVSSAAALSSKTSAASRLRLMVAAVSARFFCAYCFKVKTDAVLSNSQTRVIEITTLITLMRRSARLKVGRGA